MKYIKKIIVLAAALSLILTLCTPVSAQTDIPDEKKFNIELFVKEKNIKSGDAAYIVATVTDENNEPVENQIVYFYQNLEISGINVDQYIGEATTYEKGIAVFRPGLNVNGDSCAIFIGCATEDPKTGDAYYSDHVMITVTNPYPYLKPDDYSQEE
ncbi:MAG: hypothetical protein JXQ82_08550 [Methanomicrobiaceae archaeon]|nr:hypothetical protein [Methanomicrobiaceae archaeon]